MTEIERKIARCGEDINHHVGRLGEYTALMAKLKQDKANQDAACTDEGQRIARNLISTYRFSDGETLCIAKLGVTRPGHPRIVFEDRVEQIRDALASEFNDAIRREREACAAIADEERKACVVGTSYDCRFGRVANAIRARK